MSRYEELMSKIAELTAEAEAVRKQDMDRKVQDIKDRMKELGLTVADLADKPGKARKRAPLKPKFRNPKTGEEWTGVGRQPKWLAAEVAKGASVESFRIAAPAPAAAAPAAAPATAKAKPAAAKPAAKRGPKPKAAKK